MIEIPEYFQKRPGQSEALFFRLIGICIDTKCDGSGFVLPGGKFALQQLDSVCLEIKFAFKINSGGMAQIGVRRAGETINAAMFASPIRIDRPVKGNVRRLIFCDDRPGRFPVPVDETCFRQMIGFRGLRNF